MTTTIFENGRNLNLNYADFHAKVEYLLNKCGWQYFPNNPTLIFKNDLVIYEKMVYNYDKEQLDIINWLAKKRFVFDPFVAGGYFNEFITYTHENIQNNRLKDLRETYNLAREQFYNEVTIQ